MNSTKRKKTGPGKAGTKTKVPAETPIPLRVAGYSPRLNHFWHIDLNMALRSDVDQGIIRLRKWQSETRMILEMLEVKVQIQEIKLDGVDIGERNARLKSAVEAILDCGGWSYGVAKNIRLQPYINMGTLKSLAGSFGSLSKELTQQREALSLVYN